MARQTCSKCVVMPLSVVAQLRSSSGGTRACLALKISFTTTWLYCSVLKSLLPALIYFATES